MNEGGRDEGGKFIPERRRTVVSMARGDDMVRRESLVLVRVTENQVKYRRTS